jgi:type IV secretory pathway TrbF-like protein
MSSEAIPEVDMKAVSQPNGTGENPYLSARRHWNSQNERAFNSARVWQVIGIIEMLIVLASVAGWMKISMEPRFVPYVVEVDRLGEAVAVRPADRAAQADSRVIRASLASFISSARTVTPDVALQRDAVFRVYSMLQTKDPAKVKIDEWWNEQRKQDPFNRAANETASVEIASVLQISESAFQIDWLESVRDRDGNLKEPSSRMRAILNVYTAPVDRRATEAEIARNPLGVYVRDCNWSRIN